VGDGSTEDNSPSKLSYNEDQSPVRQIPDDFKKQATNKFNGINLTSMNKEAIDEKTEFTEKKSNGSSNKSK